MNALPHVHILTTGGTIAGKRQAAGVVAPGLTPEELLERIPEGRTVARISVEPLMNVASAAIGFREMLAIAQRAHVLVSDGNVTGVVITHGTGNLEQTAYFLECALHVDAPIVLTGAMRNPTLPSDDGPANLLDAVRVAAHPKTRGLGVLVVLNNTIHSARDVMKLHSARVEAFQSPEFGPLGMVDEDHVYVARRLFQRAPAVMPEAITARVERIPFGADSSDLFLKAALDSGADGIVIEAGRLSPRQLDLVKDALARGIVVVMANPYLTGRLHRNTYRHVGGESHLLDLGVIFTGTTALKARVKLTVLLSAGLDRARIRELFHAEWD